MHRHRVTKTDRDLLYTVAEEVGIQLIDNFHHLFRNIVIAEVKHIPHVNDGLLDKYFHDPKVKAAVRSASSSKMPELTHTQIIDLIKYCYRFLVPTMS